MVGLFNERAVRLVFLGSAIRVDERQFPTLHRLLGDVARTLDAPELPELYVVSNPFPGAVTIGMNKPFIVRQLGPRPPARRGRAAVRHRPRARPRDARGHAVYQTLLQRLLQLSGVLTAIPMGGLGVRAIVAALYEWSRKAELSADRAGLLATQDPPLRSGLHMKIASGGHLDDLDATSFFAQGQEYDDADLRDSVLKLLLIENRTHPFAVVRASELHVDGSTRAHYTRILGGDYPRRDADADAKLSEAAAEAARSYSEQFRQTQDAMGKLVHDAAGWVGSARLWLDEKLRRDGAD